MIEKTENKAQAKASELTQLLACAFCGVDMRICKDCSSDYYYGECLNADCGIVTPYKNTYKEVETIITHKAI